MMGHVLAWFFGQLALRGVFYAMPDWMKIAAGILLLAFVVLIFPIFMYLRARKDGGR